MKQALARHVERFDALSVRERLMVFAAVAAVLGFVFDQFLFEPLRAERERLTARTAQQSRLLAATRDAADALARAASDPDAANRGRREQLQREIAHVDRELEAVAKGLVPPERMAAVLEGVLGRDPRLALLGLRTLPVAPLVERKPAQGTATPAPPVAEASYGLFKHGVEVRVQGTYADLTDYAAALEGLPTRMYWARAVLDATDHPRVVLTITVYTLSFERTWLRV